MFDETDKGLSRGLTNYGDKDFSLYLRRSFAKAMGFTGESLDKPIGLPSFEVPFESLASVVSSLV